MRDAAGPLASLSYLFIGAMYAFAAAVQSGPPQIMTYEEYAKARHSSPYVIELSEGFGALLYFGAQHTTDLGHPQNAQIMQAWRRFHPTIAFNEGREPPAAKSVEEAIASFGEAGLVRFLASRDKILMRSIEPEHRAEAAILLAHFSPEQVKLFYALRQVFQSREGKLKTSSDGKMRNTLTWIANEYGLEGAPRSLIELQKSVARELKLDNWRRVPERWFDPVLSPPPTFLNEATRLSSRLRDEHMVTLIVSAMMRGERVFAVVGSTHVVMQERAIRAGLKLK